MKTNILKEALLLLIMLMSSLYLFLVWNALPQSVPMHYDISGHIDRYGSKYELMMFCSGMPAFLYLLFLIIPFIDPKGKIKAMGNKYYHLKLIMLLFISALSGFMIYTSLKPDQLNTNFLFVLLGLLFAVLGNYFQSIRPNYFIGIRTPWTLENETVWKETHKLAGKFWMIGGIAIAVLGFIFSADIFTYVFITIAASLVLVPVIYSYKRFKALKSSVSDD